MAIMRWNPARELNSLQREMNRLFDDVFDFSPRHNQGISGFTPAAEMEDKGDNYRLKLEIPGIEKDNLDIQVTADSVSIRGKRTSETQTEEDGITRSEFCYGSFHRTFSLPGRIHHESVAADYKDGILTLTLPKAEEEKRKVVKVSVG